VKLRSKFLASLLALTAALTSASLLIIRHSVNAHARQEVLSSISKASAVLEELQHRRDEAMEHSAALIADQPLLKAIMATQDPPTIQDATYSLWRSAGVNLLVVADVRGRVTAAHASGTDTTRASAQASLAQTLALNRRSDWWLAGKRLYKVFLSPVQAGSANESSTLGTLIVGYELDRQFVDEAARIASGEVVLRFGNKLVQSTLAPSYANDAEHNLLATAQTPTEVKLGKERFLTAVSPLSSGDAGGAQLIVLKSYDQATAFLASVNQLIIFVGLGTILLGTIIVFFISHKFTQPLGDLVLGVRALEDGNFEYPLKLGGKDEISELTHSFDRMRRSLKESQQGIAMSARMEAVGQLASGVAHDFNNLITVIKGYTDLLSRKLDASSPLANYVEQIKKAGERASSVTRQLLAFSRKQATQPQALELNSLILSMNKMLRVLIGEHIEISVQSDPALDKVFADPGQIEQMILNLTVNARDAMPKGGKLVFSTANVELNEAEAAAYRGAKAGRYVRMSVADTGCGMDRDTAKRIFEPFFTTKGAGHGTGLGLAIVAGITKHLAGYVQVESEVNQGSAFHIYLPAMVAHIQATPAPELISQALSGSECVLVVEDEDTVRTLIRETLTMLGYTVLEATNGIEALKTFEENQSRIEMVLTDMVMPKLGGLELIHKLRERRGDLKVLLLSGYTDRMTDIARSKVPFLDKPFTPDILASRLRQVLSNADAVVVGARS
jgi:signal transduction histidine kinase/ActR/RegA family two-component response regulator